MRRAVPVLMALLMTLTSLQAEAKRMGGGKSMGRQSSNVTQSTATPNANPAAPTAAPNAAGTQQAARPNGAAPAAAAAQQTRRPWAGMLGGLAAGLGLAWLANSLGLGEGFANIMLIALLAFAAIFLFRMLAARKNAGTVQQQPAYSGAAGAAPQNTQFQAAQPTGGSILGADLASGGASALAGSQNWGIPAGFDAEGFVTAAKRNFITLQDAWDRGDLTSLRAMLTDEMLMNMREQLAQRQNHHATAVQQLDAKLMGIEETPSDYLASVEFTGMISENGDGQFEPFREVWNMSKTKAGQTGWLVAGIQSV